MGYDMTSSSAGHSRSLVRSTVVFYGLLLLAAGLWDRYSQSVDLRWFSGDWVLDLQAIGVGAGFSALVVVGGIKARRFEFARKLEVIFQEALGRPGHGEIALLALASSVSEEIFFRGALQQSLGLWVTVIIFAALHGFFHPRYLVWSIFAGVAGLVWGILAGWSGGLVGTTVSHCLINWINLELLCHHWRE